MEWGGRNVRVESPRDHPDHISLPSQREFCSVGRSAFDRKDPLGGLLDSAMSEEISMSLAAKLRFLIIAGVGLFSDGYLNIVIGLGTPYDLYRAHST